MMVRKTTSCVNFPSSQTLEPSLSLEQKELDIEMQAVEMHHSAASTKFTDTSKMPLSQPAETAEWQRALQSALVEKHQLLVLLRKYQLLVRSVRDHDFTRYSQALDCSFRRRASTVDPHLKGIGQDMACETSSVLEYGQEKHSVRAPVEDNFGCENSDGPDDNADEDNNSNEYGHDRKEILADQCDCSVGPAEGPDRRFSSSSSFLYAGVEATPHPTPAASPPPESGRYPRTEAAPSSPLLVDIGRLAIGGWLYKYPRRQYSKLITQTSIPSNQLNYRYFWLASHRSTLCWSVSPEAMELKAEPILDFYTERRLLPAEENAVASGRQPETAAMATVIIVITGKESPLALVPATNEDLGVWMRGLTALLAMKRSPTWPHNLSFTCEQTE